MDKVYSPRMEKANEILLRRQKKLILPSTGVWPIDNASSGYVGVILKNVESLGFTFSKDVIKRLSGQDTGWLKGFYMELIPMLKRMVGADVEYNPMYPNFPQSVLERDDLELYINAIVHYISYGTLYPVEEKKERLPLFESPELTVIDVGTEADLFDIRNRLMSAKVSISQQDKDDLEWLYKKLPLEDLPEEIPFKENLAVIGALMMESPTVSENALKPYFKTATDILRLATQMSGGDVSLASTTKYKSFKRRHRWILLSLLNGLNYDLALEDMKRHRVKWLRLGEKLHPGEYNFKNVRKLFAEVRSGKTIRTWATEVEESANKGHWDHVINLLKERPGEFARRLDWLVSKVGDVAVHAFANVAINVPVPTLMSMYSHFGNRYGDATPRAFFPKGNIQKVYVETEVKQYPIPYIVVADIRRVIEVAINAQLEKLAPLGKVYIKDGVFDKLTMPYSQRSASSALHTYTRGSRISCGKNAKVVRPFIWWTNHKHEDREDRIDVDLSVSVYSDGFKNYIAHCSYTNLKNEGLVHSGDIVNGGPFDGPGVAEFVDVDIDTILKRGGRYLVFQVHSYSMQTFASMEHIRFGWMERENANEGEIFEPSTVKQKFDLTSEAQFCIPAIYDCKEREFIWCDMVATVGQRYGGNNVESNLRGTEAICYGITHMHKPYMLTAILLNAKARGQITKDRNEADIIFDDDTTPPVTKVEEKREVQDVKTGEIFYTTVYKEVPNENVPIITPFMTEYFMSELM